jgi:hypothetical protein
VPDVWIKIHVPLRPALPPNLRTVDEVALATGRTRAAVRRALDQGRIPRADPPSGRPCRPDVSRVRCVLATADDLARWRVRTLREVLMLQPDLPQNPAQWCSQAALARDLGGAQWRARRVIRELRPLRLRWSGSPWRTEVRYWIPDSGIVDQLLAYAR